MNRCDTKMKTKTKRQEINECTNGNCPINKQQNVVTPKDYILRCSNSECDYETRQYLGTDICPKCGIAILYWSYEPQDGLTDYQKRMIKKFYGDLIDTKVVIQT